MLDITLRETLLTFLECVLPYTDTAYKLLVAAAWFCFAVIIGAKLHPTKTTHKSKHLDQVERDKQRIKYEYKPIFAGNIEWATDYKSKFIGGGRKGGKTIKTIKSMLDSPMHLDSRCTYNRMANEDAYLITAQVRISRSLLKLVKARGSFRCLLTDKIISLVKKRVKEL